MDQFLSEIGSTKTKLILTIDFESLNKLTNRTGLKNIMDRSILKALSTVLEESVGSQDKFTREVSSTESTMASEDKLTTISSILEDLERAKGLEMVRDFGYQEKKTPVIMASTSSLTSTWTIKKLVNGNMSKSSKKIKKIVYCSKERPQWSTAIFNSEFVSFLRSKNFLFVKNSSGFTLEKQIYKKDAFYLGILV